ncbi:signal peptidase I [Nocardioides sp. URHA0020]|uniref:signal peptidase I n=1 Tax=Nocardioides sp. URHA0020 TaxID=1380392 RepID=UPI000685822C|nr:signal peptidase I [Nocardioides sp. URHA0020]
MVLFAPVTLFVLLPIGLGLQRYVVSSDSMAGSIDRGSIVFERVVPVSDLRVGDVVTFRAPGDSEQDAMVTHRIIAIEPDGIRTKGDAVAAPDPWVLRTEGPTMSRVELTVPWVGWAYLGLRHHQAWLLTVASAVVLVVLLSRRLRRPAPTLRASAAPEAGATPWPTGAGTSGAGVKSGTREAKQ